MFWKFCSICVALLSMSLLPRIATADPGLLRTSHALDETRGYCLDIPGFGATARLEEPLQAHTCKYGAPNDDQLFERVVETAQLRAPYFDRCVAAEALAAGADLMAAPCADGPLQRWQLAWEGLSPASRPDLCVAVAGGQGEVAGTPVLITPVYRRRTVTLEPCADALQARQSLRWSSPDERDLSTADVARRGLPSSIAAELDGLGRAFNGDIVRQTSGMFASAQRIYSPEEIVIVDDVAYGQHENQRLDIHTATARSSETLVPTVIVFHGGGLIGGSPASTANVANYFASLGFVGVNGTYQRAPVSTWPQGGRDVGAAVGWLQENIAEYGGDPEQIFVMGLSTGAFHTATYVFRPDLLAPGTPRAAGAMLFSGPYTFDFANPSPGELAYFGEDASRYPEMVVVGNVTATDIPVLLTTAEYDIPRYTTAFSALLRELIVERQATPRYGQYLGHNHTSQVLAIGTSDATVSSQLIDFIQRTAAERQH